MSRGGHTAVVPADFVIGCRSTGETIKMDDFDFDGSIDVAVATSSSATNGLAFDYLLMTSDGIEPSDALDSVQLVNPTFDAETEQIHTLVSVSADVRVELVYEWDGDELPRPGPAAGGPVLMGR